MKTAATAFLLLLAGCAAPQGPEVQSLAGSQLTALVRASKGQTVLVNVWATWCGPCVSEMPALRKIQQELDPSKFRLILVSVDEPERKARVAEFLGSLGFPAPAYIKDGGDEEFLRALESRWSGAIPTSLLYNPKGELADYWEGSRGHEELSAAVGRVMGVAP